MKSQLLQWRHKLRIWWLMLLAPAKLFKTINQLEWYQNTLHTWVNELDICPGEKVLEIGCETGSLSRYLASLGHQVTAVDRSDRMIETARLGQSQVDFQIADAAELPFETAQYDVVIAASLINIVSDQQAVIAEMVRVCKPGGLVSIFIPRQGFDKVRLEALIRDLELSGFSEAVLRAWHGSAPKMRLDDIKLLFDNANLNMLSSRGLLQGMVMFVCARKHNE